MKIDIQNMTVHGALEGMAKGAFSSVELTRALLDEIATKNAAPGAYVFTGEAAALEMAAQADARRGRGETAPLLGVPVALRDDISVKGQPCECGSKILAGFRAMHDAAIVERLKNAGAVLLGRVNMDEFGLGGDAAATVVANGLAVAAIATDTGGAQRQAAARCGCIALRPTYGRVSRHGVLSVASSMDQPAVVTKDARDAALLFSVLFGHDARDAMALHNAAHMDCTAPRRGVKGVRIGVVKEWADAGARAAAERLEAAGAVVVETSLPHAKFAEAVYTACMSAEAAACLARFDGVRYGFRAKEARDVNDVYVLSRSQALGFEAKKRIILGTAMTGREFSKNYFHALKVRTLIRGDFTRAFETCDALFAPSNADAFTTPASLAGVCALSIHGVQIIGPAMGEESILNIGSAL